MTDKELLELAAKAYWSDNDDVSFSFSENDNAIVFYDPVNQDHNGRDFGLVWNPLTDDGDALRLAVRLNLLILPYPDDKAVRVTRLDQPDTIVSWGTPPDPGAATRRAIVRAAAAFGKDMP